MQAKKAPEEDNQKSQSQKLNEIVKKNWPIVKEEMEKRAQDAKKLIAQGEKHLVEFTDLSVKKLRKLSLIHKREKHYQDLGKLVAALPKEEIANNEKVNEHLMEIKKIENEIAAL